MIKFGIKSKRFWRPLIGLVIAYAVGIQSLLIGVVSPTLQANADDGSPDFELCLHGAQDPPRLPADTPGHLGYGHCIFCSAGSHHALIAQAPAPFHHIDVKITNVRWAADDHRVPHLPAYSIANPRGPPLGA